MNPWRLQVEFEGIIILSQSFFIGFFKGDIEEIFDQLNGKELSYNNLLDVNSAIKLISEFKDPTFAILKHNNACGIASSSSAFESYAKAFEADPLSAFGGVLILTLI